jgi:hypothetical protein
MGNMTQISLRSGPQDRGDLQHMSRAVSVWGSRSESMALRCAVYPGPCSVSSDSLSILERQVRLVVTVGERALPTGIVQVPNGNADVTDDGIEDKTQDKFVSAVL